MLKIHLIRHGKTKGNENGRYIGSTNEPVSPAGINALRGNISLGLYPDCDAVYTSPMLRCLQTADILYPDKPRFVIPALAEYHFGLFEGKNYAELNGNTDYQTFIDSGGRTPIPGAPPLEDYFSDCVSAFYDILKNPKDTISIICHGGTIMAIMRNIYPQSDTYYFRSKNGEGYIIEYNRSTGESGIIHKIGIEK